MLCGRVVAPEVVWMALVPTMNDPSTLTMSGPQLRAIPITPCMLRTHRFPDDLELGARGDDRSVRATGRHDVEVQHRALRHVHVVVRVRVDEDRFARGP